MSNGLPPISHKGEVPESGDKVEIPYLAAYAEGCEPWTDAEEWWPIHNAIEGGDDFVLPIPIGSIEEALNEAKSHIVIVADRKKYIVLSDEEFENWEA